MKWNVDNMPFQVDQAINIPLLNIYKLLSNTILYNHSEYWVKFNDVILWV